MSSDSLSVQPSFSATTDTAPKARPLPVVRRSRRCAAELFNQQIWCWGQDIRYPEKNLLLTYGFTRHRPPPGEQRASCYTLSVSPSAHVALWGFGMFYGDVRFGGLFLRRYTFAPHWSPWATLPDSTRSPVPSAAPALPRTLAGRLSVCRLTIAALRWIAAYERWVRGEVGIDYRHRCVAAFPSSTIPAERMIVTWSDIAGRYQRRAALLCAGQRNQGQKERGLHV